ncbi:MAG: DUF99 family protein [Nitrososphaerales archaeon]|nr:DUF99 family protein [Nitrososphaerales archaeon]
MRIHLNKKGIRVLGVAESFRQPQRRSLLAGVVMRGDFVVDGATFGRTSVGGDDATKAVASLYRKLRRNDVNLVMVSGAILSLYNIIDVDALAWKTRLPVICLTYKETGGIEQSIVRHFPERKEQKLEAYRRLGKRQRLRLSSGFTVYARTSGLTDKETLALVDMFTLQGSLPEPVRVAKLLARAGAAF